MSGAGLDLRQPITRRHGRPPLMRVMRPDDSGRLQAVFARLDPQTVDTASSRFASRFPSRPSNAAPRSIASASPGWWWRSAAAAQDPGLGVRTLNRRPAAQGTGFMQLREDAASTIARQPPTSTRMPVSAIAGSLGYSATPIAAGSPAPCSAGPAWRRRNGGDRNGDAVSGAVKRRARRGRARRAPGDPPSPCESGIRASADRTLRSSNLIAPP